MLFSVICFVQVVAVMAHDISVLPHMKAGIVLYRHMKDTVRSQFAAKHGPGAVLEAPMEAYYGEKLSCIITDCQNWSLFLDCACVGTIHFVGRL